MIGIVSSCLVLCCVAFFFVLSCHVLSCLVLYCFVSYLVLCVGAGGWDGWEGACGVVKEATSPATNAKGNVDNFLIVPMALPRQDKGSNEARQEKESAKTR